MTYNKHTRSMRAIVQVRLIALGCQPLAGRLHVSSYSQIQAKGDWRLPGACSHGRLQKSQRISQITHLRLKFLLYVCYICLSSIGQRNHVARFKDSGMGIVLLFGGGVVFSQEHAVK